MDGARGNAALPVDVKIWRGDIAEFKCLLSKSGSTYYTYSSISTQSLSDQKSQVKIELKFIPQHD
jgi:hypothetical protein